MTAIRAIFDGKVFVPQQPVDIPVGTAANIVVQPSATPAKKSEQSTANASDDIGELPLMGLLRMLEKLPRESNLPSDASMEVDHYLYGMPKRNSQ